LQVNQYFAPIDGHRKEAKNSTPSAVARRLSLS